MPKSRALPKGWEKWGHKLGYSFKQGDLRAELWPGWVHWSMPWNWEVWREGDRKHLLALGSAPDHWRGLDAVHEAVARIENGD